MTGMTMPQQTWYGAAAGYLATWMAMMVPMMLPSFVATARPRPMLWARGGMASGWACGAAAPAAA
ncbi:hypothetical protein BH24GEM1_BH24GEM1_09550 [soil metagenome]